jgi:hypothetical protein
MKPLPLRCGTQPLEEHPVVMIERQNKPKKINLKTHIFPILIAHLTKFNHFSGINQPSDTLLLSNAKARAEA